LGLEYNKLYNPKLIELIMRANIFTTGLALSVVKEDKDKERLECMAKYKDNEIKVVLKIVDDVKNSGREIGGFHMQAWPFNTYFDKCKNIFVYLSKERWKELTTKFETDAFGGCLESRCKYDRFSINYFDEALVPKYNKKTPI
jgi:hypothetical protein